MKMNVLTVSNKTVPASRCRKITIKGNTAYYEKNVDCFYLTGTNGKNYWYTVTGGKIAQDEVTGKWELKSRMKKVMVEPLKVVYTSQASKSNFFHIAVFIDPKGQRISSEITDPVLYLTLREHKDWFSDMNGEALYYKNTEEGHQFLKSRKSGKRERSMLQNPYNRHKYPWTLRYTLSQAGYSRQIAREYAKHREKVYHPTALATALANYFNNTFGIEFETRHGALGINDLYLHNVCPMRDGSLGGGIEYTTNVLSSAHDYMSLEKLCNLLGRATVLSSNCAFQVSVGTSSINTKQKLVALYVALMKLEGDFLGLVHPYRKSLNYYQQTRQMYARPIDRLGFPRMRLRGTPDEKTINKMLQKIHEFYSVTQTSYQMGMPHSQEGQNKWNVQKRYFWVNILDTFYGNNPQHKRLEFRPHHATTNFIKVFAWLILCKSVVKFVENENNHDHIFDWSRKLTIDDIIEPLNNVSPQLVNYLREYVQYTEGRWSMLKQVEDFTETKELSGDAKFRFKAHGVTNPLACQIIKKQRKPEAIKQKGTS